MKQLQGRIITMTKLKTLKLLISVVLGYLLVVWGISVSYKYRWLEILYPPGNIKELGAFGDFFGGMLNPLLTLLLIVMAYVEFKSQKEKLRIENAEKLLELTYLKLEVSANQQYPLNMESSVSLQSFNSLMYQFTNRYSDAAIKNLNNVLLTNPSIQILLYQLTDYISLYLDVLNSVIRERLISDWFLKTSNIDYQRLKEVRDYISFILHIKELLLKQEALDTSEGLREKSIATAILSVIDHKVALLDKRADSIYERYNEN